MHLRQICGFSWRIISKKNKDDKRIAVMHQVRRKGHALISVTSVKRFMDPHLSLSQLRLCLWEGHHRAWHTYTSVCVGEALWLGVSVLLTPTSACYLTNVFPIVFSCCCYCYSVTRQQQQKKKICWVQRCWKTLKLLSCEILSPVDILAIEILMHLHPHRKPV